MPFKSEAQRRYMTGCAKNPEQMKGGCPSKAVAGEFIRKSEGKKLPERVKGKSLGR